MRQFMFQFLFPLRPDQATMPSPPSPTGSKASNGLRSQEDTGGQLSGRGVKGKANRDRDKADTGGGKSSEAGVTMGTKNTTESDANGEKGEVPCEKGNDTRKGRAEGVAKHKTARKKGGKDKSSKPYKPPVVCKKQEFMVPLSKAMEPSYTGFEKLYCPQLLPKHNMSQLRELCSAASLTLLHSNVYTSHSTDWEKHEPHPPATPTLKTDPAAITDPMPSAVFDEIWCPILADVAESDSIVLPTFHYVM